MLLATFGLADPLLAGAEALYVLYNFHERIYEAAGFFTSDPPPVAPSTSSKTKHIGRALRRLALSNAILMAFVTATDERASDAFNS